MQGPDIVGVCNIHPAGYKAGGDACAAAVGCIDLVACRVVAGATFQRVLTGAAGKNVVAVTPVERVVAVTADQRIIAAVAGDGVVAAPAVQGIAIGIARQRVGAVGCDNVLDGNQPGESGERIIR
nr:hypothetical protein [uncultured Gellertiella sp.]